MPLLHSLFSLVYFKNCGFTLLHNYCVSKQALHSKAEREEILIHLTGWHDCQNWIKVSAYVPNRCNRNTNIDSYILPISSEWSNDLILLLIRNFTDFVINGTKFKYFILKPTNLASPVPSRFSLRAPTLSNYLWYSATFPMSLLSHYRHQCSSGLEDRRCQNLTGRWFTYYTLSNSLRLHSRRRKPSHYSICLYKMWDWSGVDLLKKTAQWHQGSKPASKWLKMLITTFTPNVMLGYCSKKIQPKFIFRLTLGLALVVML